MKKFLNGFSDVALGVAVVYGAGGTAFSAYQDLYSGVIVFSLLTAMTVGTLVTGWGKYEVKAEA